MLREIDRGILSEDTAYFKASFSFFPNKLALAGDCL